MTPTQWRILCRFMTAILRAHYPSVGNAASWPRGTFQVDELTELYQDIQEAAK